MKTFKELWKQRQRGFQPSAPGSKPGYEFTRGEEVHYHGRTGKVADYEAGGYLVHFYDTGKDEWIDKDELREQNE